MEELITQFLNYLLYEKGYSKNTIESYHHDMTEFFSFISRQEISKIEDIQYRTLYRYIAEMGELGLKASSIERKVASLKSFFHYLMKNEIIKKNPASIVSSPKKEKRLPAILEKEEILALIASIPEKDALSVRNKTMVMLLYSSGVRISELTGLDLKNTDFTEGILSITGKGNKQRLVPVGEKTRKMLQSYLTYRRELSFPGKGNEALFLTKSGKRIQDRMVRYIINRYIDELSIQKHISPHTLRHTFATHLLENGANIRVIQEILGHASLSTTQVYTHLTIDKLKESYEKFHPHA
jgi:tyrosine recombinase XerC